MKDVIRISVLGFAVAGLMAFSCWPSSETTENTSTLSPEEISWIEFCKARGYDIHDDRDEIINEFLDAWVGSVEEERVFNNLPAMEG